MIRNVCCAALMFFVAAVAASSLAEEPKSVTIKGDVNIGTGLRSIVTGFKDAPSVAINMQAGTVTITGPADDVEVLVKIAALLESKAAGAVPGLRNEQLYSFGDIADAEALSIGFGKFISKRYDGATLLLPSANQPGAGVLVVRGNQQTIDLVQAVADACRAYHQAVKKP